MKKQKKSIYIIFTFLISFFCFNLDVKAAIPEQNLFTEKTSKMSCDDIEQTYQSEFDSGNVLFDADGYTTNCVYTHWGKDADIAFDGILSIISFDFIDKFDTVTNKFPNQTGKRCAIFQIAFNENEGQARFYRGGSFQDFTIKVFDEDGEKEKSNTKFFSNTAKITKDQSLETLSSNFMQCKRNVYYDFEWTMGLNVNNHGLLNVTGLTHSIKINSDGGVNDKPMRLAKGNTDIELPEVDPLVSKIETSSQNDTCEEILGDGLVSALQKIYTLLKIGIPLVLFALAIVDVVQAIFSGSEDKMKKAQGKLMKRVIIAVVIFLIPTILGLVLNIANNIWPQIDNSLCGIKL